MASTSDDVTINIRTSRLDSKPWATMIIPFTHLDHSSGTLPTPCSHRKDKEHVKRLKMVSPSLSVYQHVRKSRAEAIQYLSRTQGYGMKGATTNPMQLRFFMFGHDVETYAKEALSALWPTVTE